MSNYLVRVSLLLFSLFAVFTLCYLLGGLDVSLLLLKQLLLRSARFLFLRLVGWEVPFGLILFVLSGLNDYTCHMQDPAGGQPAANPAAEQPAANPNPAAEQPSNGASTSGEDSLRNLFRLRDGLLRGDAEIITLLKDRMIFRRAANDAGSQN